MLDKLAPPAEEAARETTEAWIEAVGAALARGDERALFGLFADDAHWRLRYRGLKLRNGGAFSQARIYSRYIALQIDAIEQGRLAKRIEARD